MTSKALDFRGKFDRLPAKLRHLADTLEGYDVVCSWDFDTTGLSCLCVRDGPERMARLWSDDSWTINGDEDGIPFDSPCSVAIATAIKLNAERRP